MTKHIIEVTNNCKGSVTIGEALLTAQLSYLKMEGKLKEYSFELTNLLGDTLKFSLYKSPKDEWFEFFLFPVNPNDSELIQQVKEKIKEMGI